MGRRDSGARPELHIDDGSRTVGPAYQDLEPGAIRLRVFQVDCLCLSLTQLIRSKRAAGRPKDLEALAELEALADEAEGR
jgi:hypothetical protein